MIDQLKQLLDQYDNCMVECDGFTRIATYALNHAGIPHRIYCGYALCKNGGDEALVSPHFWIEVEDQKGTIIVDYRLRCWCGYKAPHGVRYKETATPNQMSISYEGKQIQLHVNETLFDILTSWRKSDELQ